MTPSNQPALKAAENSIPPEQWPLCLQAAYTTDSRGVLRSNLSIAAGIINDLRTRFAEVDMDWHDALAELQRLQPAGSPPPGGAREHAKWIVDAVTDEVAELRAEHALIGGYTPHGDPDAPLPAVPEGGTGAVCVVSDNRKLREALEAIAPLWTEARMTAQAAGGPSVQQIDRLRNAGKRADATLRRLGLLTRGLDGGDIDLAALIPHQAETDAKSRVVRDAEQGSACAAGVRKYRKKPVVIEAVQFRELSRTPREHGESIELNDAEIADFMRLPIRVRFLPEEGSPQGRAVIEIETLEGVMRADVGDWIINGVKGEFYPCKPDIFAATYDVEPASSPAPAGATASPTAETPEPATENQTNV